MNVVTLRYYCHLWLWPEATTELPIWTPQSRHCYWSHLGQRGFRFHCGPWSGLLYWRSTVIVFNSDCFHPGSLPSIIITPFSFTTHQCHQLGSFSWTLDLYTCVIFAMHCNYILRCNWIILCHFHELQTNTPVSSMQCIITKFWDVTRSYPFVYLIGFFTP